MTTRGTDGPQRDPWFGQRLEMCSSVNLEVDSAEMAIP